MKNIFLLLSVLFLSANTFAQGSFKSENGALVWEQQIEATNADVVNILNREANLKVTGLMDNIYKGYAQSITPNCPEGSALLKNECKFEFLIVVNPDFYVVKIKNIKILEHYGPMGARIMANPAEKYFIYDGGLNSNPDTVKDMNCLDRYFAGLFAMPAASQGAVTVN